jgi:peptidoglycan/LPS O-acetylase OafA/YrhL
MLALDNSPWINNFHLLRLLASVEVLLAHGTAHLKTPLPSIVIDFLWWFPGVPIFFIASWFLISLSFHSNHDLKLFFRNRALRIFPALWMCLLVSLFFVTIFGYAENFWLKATFWKWLLAQSMAYSSLAQILGVGLFSGYGTHDLNGALWTLSVELQFYLLLPLLFFMMGKAYKRVFTLSFAFISSLVIYFVTINYWSKGLIDNRVLIAYTSVFPHLFVFLIGVAAYLYFERIKSFLQDKFFYWFSAYLLVRGILYLTGYVDYWVVEQSVAFMLLTKILLAGLVLSFVFSFQGLSQRLIGQNDISYGVYIYQMVVINVLVELGFVNGFLPLLIAMLLTFMFALLSWRFIEKPALSFKKSKPFIAFSDAIKAN